MAQTKAQQEAVERKRASSFDEDMVRDVSFEVYKIRLERDGGKGAVERLIAKNGLDGIRSIAGAYDPLTRAYLSVLVRRWRLGEGQTP